MLGRDSDPSPRFLYMDHTEVPMMPELPRGVAEFAKMLDHTAVRPDATLEDVLRGAREAAECKVKLFAVNPPYIKAAKEALGGSGVLLGASVGYPSGAHLPEMKVFEAERVVADGADELDMVLNIGALKSGHYAVVEEEIAGVVNAAAGRTVKVIIETCYLTDEEKRTACRVCAGIEGVHFVKTSTGLGPGGATVSDVGLMKAVVGERLGVKAAGGIRTAEDAVAMMRAGATRIGTSQGPAVIAGYAKMLQAGRI